MRLRVLVVLAAAIGVVAPASVYGQEFVRPEFRAERITEPPVIDGALDDAAWRGTPLPTSEFLSYNPLHGSSIPQKTTVWLTYDADYLYFAFKCDDPDPSGIKTSITRRDNIWQDDWVGLSLDALGTGQLSYHLLVNASGVQLDMLNSVAGNEDPSPDWIWDSASRLTDTGYSAEIRLPLHHAAWLVLQGVVPLPFLTRANADFTDCADKGGTPISLISQMSASAPRSFAPRLHEEWAWTHEYDNTQSHVTRVPGPLLMRSAAGRRAR
jgi:Carbohydrate family 9 binding domain-like